MTGDGLDDVAAAARGTTVLVGPSGAGKSTLANALLGEEALAVGEVRASDGKGRHTTVHRELVPFDGGVLVDTPGLRAVGLIDAAEGIDKAFTDVVELADGCRFADCAHDREPGCAVRAAVERPRAPGAALGGLPQAPPRGRVGGGAHRRPARGRTSGPVEDDHQGPARGVPRAGPLRPG